MAVLVLPAERAPPLILRSVSKPQAALRRIVVGRNGRVPQQSKEFRFVVGDRCGGRR